MSAIDDPCTIERINTFFKKIEEAKISIHTITDEFFQRSLLYSVLDILAKCAFPSTKGNRDRFVNLIDIHSQWPDKDRYSLLFLNSHLKKINDPHKYPTLTTLREEGQKRMLRWPIEKRLIFPREFDPPRKDLRCFIIGEIAILIERVRYPSLIWKDRNYAIHELSHAGLGMDFEIGSPSPYYHHLIHGESGKEIWELYFPIDFISWLVSDCAANLQQWLITSAINPYDSFKRRPDWYAGT